MDNVLHFFFIVHGSVIIKLLFFLDLIVVLMMFHLLLGVFHVLMIYLLLLNLIFHLLLLLEELLLSHRVHCLRVQLKVGRLSAGDPVMLLIHVFFILNLIWFLQLIFTVLFILVLRLILTWLKPYHLIVLLMLEISQTVLDLLNVSHGLSKVKLLSTGVLSSSFVSVVLFEIMFFYIRLRINHLNNGLVHLIWVVQVLIENGLILILIILYMNLINIFFFIFFLVLIIRLDVIRLDCLSSVGLRLIFLLTLLFIINVYFSWGRCSINWQWFLDLFWLASIRLKTITFILLVALLIWLLIEHTFSYADFT